MEPPVTRPSIVSTGNSLKVKTVILYISSYSTISNQLQIYHQSLTLSSKRCRSTATILRLLEDEIPHGVAVVVEEFKEKKNARRKKLKAGPATETKNWQ